MARLSIKCRKSFSEIPKASRAGLYARRNGKGNVIFPTLSMRGMTTGF